MDEIFGKQNRVQVIAVKTASPAGFKTVNPGPIDVTEYILFYAKDRKSFQFRRNFVPIDYDENYDLYIENIEDKPEDWKLTPLRDVIYKINNIPLGKSSQASSSNAKAVWGEHWKIIRYQVMAKFALDNCNKVVSVRDPHKPSERLKEALERSKEKRDKILVFKKSVDDEELNEDDKKESYLFNSGALSFYANKVVNIDGQTTPSMLLTDFWNDISWDGIAKEGGVKLKNGKKPEKLIKRIIEMTAQKDDIVMDFHLGSGTTAAVAHKLGYQYIGIEQLKYKENDSVVRLQNVIKGDQSGVSKSINWQGGGDFIRCELMKYNEVFIERIQSAKTNEDLIQIWRDIAEGSFLNWYVNSKSPAEAVYDFEGLGREEGGLEKQKRLLFELLDKNQLYVNLSEIDDDQFKVTVEEKALNKSFYSEAFGA